MSQVRSNFQLSLDPIINPYKYSLCPDAEKLQSFKMDPKFQELVDILSKAEDLASSLRQDLATDSKFRIQLIETSKCLTRTLQTPIEQSWDIFFQPHQLSILHTALDAGWLDAINRAGESGTTADQLASTSGSDISLVRRLMRFLVSAGSVKEVGVNTYASTEISIFLCMKNMSAGLRHAGHDYAVPVSKMPEYFASNGYQTPPSAEYGIYNYARGSPFLKCMKQRPSVAEQFHTFMAAAKAGKKSWMDTFPVETLRVDSNDCVLLVDVGGGKGHELAGFATRQRDVTLQGKLVLQDLPQVIAQVPSEWHSLFTAQAHDFFTPQKDQYHHARAYYMRNVCHGWSDKDCINILTHIRDAMKPGYSSLLINEIVLPDTGCSFWGAGFDVTMMTVVNGMERTKKEWEELISTVTGLRIERIWALEAKGDSIIEVERAE